MNLPNRITVLRIILTPVLVLLFYCRLYIICAVVFFAASLTDMIDGKIARKRGLVTVFGKFFDPLADQFSGYYYFSGADLIRPAILVWRFCGNYSGYHCGKRSHCNKPASACRQ